MPVRVLSVLTLVLLFLAGCGKEPKHRAHAEPPAVPDSLSIKPMQVGEKPSAEEIQLLEGFFAKIIKMDVLNLWLVKDADQPDSNYSAGSEQALLDAVEKIKSQCQIKGLTEDIQTEPIGRSLNRNDRSTQEVSRIDAEISGAKCPINSTLKAEGKKTGVVKFTGQQFTHDLDVVRVNLDSDLIQLIGIKRDALEGRLQTVTSVENNKRKKQTQIQGSVLVELPDGATLSYGLDEEKIEVRTALKMENKKVRADYVMTFTINDKPKSFAIRFESNGTIGNSNSTVQVNGIRLSETEAPTLNKAASRLILK